MVRHLYIHVPFCLRRCSYCDFAVQAVNAAPTAAWLDAVDAEMGQVVEAGSHLSTIYVGGGTPSLIGGAGMRGLRDILARRFTWDTDVEWTSEANPETFTEDVAHQWRDAGVNRISMGAQTFSEEALRWMGRMHGTDGPARAFDAARAAGIDNVSIDLIFGLPARFNRDWAGDLQRVLALEPEHVSLYGLTAEKNTPLGRWVADGKETLADEDQYVDEYTLAVETLTQAGYDHYEVSNFARPGRRSRHNQAYWDGVPYLGIGPGAHSFVAPVRWWNVRDWADYAGRLGRGESPRESEEFVDSSIASLERKWLGLRTDSGLRLEELTSPQQARLSQWEKDGLASVDGGVARLTTQGWLVLDRLVVELDF